MKHLIIENVGPIKYANLYFNKYNVIIGPQSSGKSCVIKIASFCTWVEKRIQLLQSVEEFNNDNFIDNLVNFHKLFGYLKPESKITYETHYLRFSYFHETKELKFYWGKIHYEYKRPKVSYIPAERNLVSVIPNWMDLTMKRNNIVSFLSDWDVARKSVKDLDILNLGVKYHYDFIHNTDEVFFAQDKRLELTNTSSGLQSLIPLLIHLKYLTEDIYNDEKSEKIKDQHALSVLPLILNEKLGSRMSSHYNKKFSTPRSTDSPLKVEIIGQHPFVFPDIKVADRIKRVYDNLINTKRSDVFIEEPEENLFPPTQKQLIEWILDNSKNSTFTIATHSPYILTTFLSNRVKDFSLFYIPNFCEESIVKTATQEELQEIFDYGVDAFFNIDTLG